MQTAIFLLLVLGGGHLCAARRELLAAGEDAPEPPSVSIKASPLMEFRIAGGEAAPAGEYPWMAVLYSNIATDPVQKLFHYCSGTLVAPDVVMTAASCTLTRSGSELVPAYIRAGLTEVTNTSAPERTVLNVFRHPEFDPRTYVNDVALLQLNRTIKSSVAPPVPLARADTDVDNDEKLTLMGFGATPTAILSKSLLYTSVRAVNSAACGDFYKDYFNVTLPGTAMCAGSLASNNTCVGDSGAPLLNAEGLQVGLASFYPTNCGGIANIAVYTEVSQVRKWINAQLREIRNMDPENEE